MVDLIEERRPPGRMIGSDPEQIVEDIERQARIAEESGRAREGASLRRWADELRQKSIRAKLKLDT